MRGIELKTPVDETEAEEEAGAADEKLVEDEAGAADEELVEDEPARFSSTPSLLGKGREENEQWSHINAISPPSLTQSLYLARETEREHRTCVHLMHKSHSTALLALVTPLAQTAHG